MPVYRSLTASVVAATTLMAGPALAQDVASFPSRPVTVIIPFVPGGSTEVETRIYTDKLQASLKQQFVLDFRGGTGGLIGALQLQRSAPDGYSIMIANTGFTVTPNFHPQINHEAAKTFVPITELSNRTTAVIASVAGLPNVNNLKDLEAYAKANPGKLSCNTAGAGGITHIVCSALANAIHSPILPVHYKGVAQGQIDLIAGRTQVSGGTLLAGLAQIKSGKLKALAIFGNKRTPLLPDVPTVEEQGYEAFYPSWFGAFAPPKTPPAISNKLNAEFVRAVRSPDVIAALEKLGTSPVGNSQEEFRKKIESELVYWKKIVETNKIKLEE